MKKLKKIPEFKNENEEAEFWSAHDSTEYIDWSKVKNYLQELSFGRTIR